MNELIERARAAVQAAALPGSGGPILERTMGLFVTLRDASGGVRGSVGTTEGHRSLGELLETLVREAAEDDPRHPPIAVDEANSLELELWLLPDPPRPVRDPADFDPLHDALRVCKGIYAGALLPDVASANDWNAATSLAYACRKAGLSAHAWREPDIEIQAFRAIRVQ